MRAVELIKSSYRRSPILTVTCLTLDAAMWVGAGYFLISYALR